MAKDKRASQTLGANIELYEKRAQPFRIRFRISGELHDFGYYEAYNEALILRNLIAMRLGRDTIEDEIFAAVTDETIEQYEEDFAEILAKAAEIGENTVDGRAIRGRTTTASLQSQIDQLKITVSDLEHRLRLIQAQL